jgi:hypothetical protein
MELRKVLAPAAASFFPAAWSRKFYGEQWQKSLIDVQLRDHEETVAIKTHPLPYLEVHFRVSNQLPVDLQIFGCSVEVWLGKPVVQFYTYLSDSMRPGETREGLRAYTFLNNFQCDLLNPPKKDMLPPNVTIILTVSCRSSLGTVEKTVKTSWLPPRVVP